MTYSLLSPSQGGVPSPDRPDTSRKRRGDELMNWLRLTPAASACAAATRSCSNTPLTLHLRLPPRHEPGERRQGFFADMVFDALGVLAGGVGGDA